MKKILNFLINIPVWVEELIKCYIKNRHLYVYVSHKKINTLENEYCFICKRCNKVYHKVITESKFKKLSKEKNLGGIHSPRGIKLKFKKNVKEKGNS